MNSRHPQGRFNTGPVRGETPPEGRWLVNRAEERQAKQAFTGAPEMVPTNPRNYESWKPRGSDWQYDAIAQGLIPRTNPYGDGRQFVRPEEPLLTTPGPAANMVMASEPAKGAEAQVNTPGYGFGMDSRLSQIDGAMQKSPTPPPASEPAPALGMSTGVSLGGGPQRNVPKPA